MINVIDTSRINIMSCFSKEEQENIEKIFEVFVNNLTVINEIHKELGYYIEYYNENITDFSASNVVLIINSFIESIFIRFRYFLTYDGDCFSIYEIIKIIYNKKNEITNMCDLFEKHNLNNYLKYSCFITRQKRDILKLLNLIEKIETKYIAKNGKKISIKNKILKRLKDLGSEVAHLFNPDKKDVSLSKMSYKKLNKTIGIYIKIFIYFYEILARALFQQTLLIENHAFSNSFVEDAKIGLLYRKKILSQDDSNCDKIINSEYERGKNDMFNEIKNLLKM